MTERVRWGLWPAVVLNPESPWLTGAQPGDTKRIPRAAHGRLFGYLLGMILLGVCWVFF